MRGGRSAALDIVRWRLAGKSPPTRLRAMSAWRLIPPGEKVVAVGGGGGRKYGLSATPVFVAGRAIRGVGAPMVTLGGQKSNNALAFTESRGPRGWRFQERSSDKLTALESARPRVCASLKTHLPAMLESARTHVCASLEQAPRRSFGASSGGDARWARARLGSFQLLDEAAIIAASRIRI